MRIGFIGVGVMGSSMVRHLKNHGHEVTLYTRSKQKIADLLAEGFAWTDSPAECARHQDCVMTMVGYPKDVEEVYYGDKGILANADTGTLLIDLTTSSPALAERLWQDAKKLGLAMLDAPVSGGDSGARAGTLSVMVGGEQADFDRALPLLMCFSSGVKLCGAAGSGQHVKMCNQIVIAGTVAGTAEAIAYAMKHNLDTAVMMDCITKGAAGSWQLTNNGQKMLDGNDAPGFYIKHFIKDMKIADGEADQAGLDLAVLKTVLGMYEALGLDDSGTQAIIHNYLK